LCTSLSKSLSTSSAAAASQCVTCIPAIIAIEYTYDEYEKLTSLSEHKATGRKSNTTKKKEEEKVYVQLFLVGFNDEYLTSATSDSSNGKEDTNLDKEKIEESVKGIVSLPSSGKDEGTGSILNENSKGKSSKPNLKFSLLQQYCQTLTVPQLFLARDIYGFYDTHQPDCVICLTEPKDAILLPCRHFTVCHACLPFINKCPVCRCSFDTYMVFYDGKGN